MSSSACTYRRATTTTRTSASPALFFFNDTATTEIYTLSLHDALPISGRAPDRSSAADRDTWPSICTVTHNGPAVVSPPTSATSWARARAAKPSANSEDRKSTRLNSSHSQISYVVFCLHIQTRHDNDANVSFAGTFFFQ